MVGPRVREGGPGLPHDESHELGVRVPQAEEVAGASSREVALEERPDLLVPDRRAELRVQAARARRDVGPLVLAAHGGLPDRDRVGEEPVVGAQGIQRQHRRRADATAELDRRIRARNANRSRKIPRRHHVRRKLGQLFRRRLDLGEPPLEGAVRSVALDAQLHLLLPAGERRELLVERVESGLERLDPDRLTVGVGDLALEGLLLGVDLSPLRRDLLLLLRELSRNALRRGLWLGLGLRRGRRPHRHGRQKDDDRPHQEGGRPSAQRAHLHSRMSVPSETVVPV